MVFVSLLFCNFDSCYVYNEIEAPNIIITLIACELVVGFASKCQTLVAALNISVHGDHLCQYVTCEVTYNKIRKTTMIEDSISSTVKVEGSKRAYARSMQF